MTPLVSIVVLTYNSEKYVLETLLSIKDQTYRNIELIISDDGSSDKTKLICLNWIEENKASFVRAEIISVEANSGIPANCNRGIKAAKGEWIKIIAGDDLLIADAIEIIIDEINLDTTRQKLAYHGKMIEFLDDSPALEVPDVWGDPGLQHFNSKDTTPEQQFNILLRFCPVSAPTAILHRSVFEKVGYFDERFKYWEDRPMWLKMTSNGIRFYFINRNLVKYRRHIFSVQKNPSNTMFSRTLLSMDQGYGSIILPHLPRTEYYLFSYMIFIRKTFYRIFNNRKTIPINILYKLLIVCPKLTTDLIKHKYSP